MKGDDLRAIASCNTERDAARIFDPLEEHLTPMELAQLEVAAPRFPAPAVNRLRRMLAMAPFAGKAPQSFRRVVVAPDVLLFRDRKVDTARKKLIVAFCGARNRLDMPMPPVLQSLPSDAVDVAVLRDRSRRHYFDGIAPYAPDFVRLVDALERDLNPHRYSDVYAYGTSMGGLPAIRYALLRPVRRAVSMGGIFPGHVGRLLESPTRQLSAFDLLCDCVARRPADIVCVYGDGTDVDRRNAERVARIRPVRQFVVPNVAIHNVAFELARSGRLPAFFAEMFDLAVPASGAGNAWPGLPALAGVPIVSAA